PLLGGRRSAALRAEVPQLQAFALRHDSPPVRVLRALRGGGDRPLRRGPVRARHRARPDPGARLALSPRRPERRRPRWLQRTGAEAGPRDEPARAEPRAVWLSPRARLA